MKISAIAQIHYLKPKCGNFKISEDKFLSPLLTISQRTSEDRTPRSRFLSFYAVEMPRNAYFIDLVVFLEKF